MRMAAARSAERTARTSLAVGPHPVDRAGLAPLAIVLIGLATVLRRVHDDAVVAVAVGDIDASGRSSDRVAVRIDSNVGRLVQQRMAGVERGGLAARRERVCRGRRPVTLSLSPDLRDARGIRPLGGGSYRVIFLDDAVAVSPKPNIALVIDVAAMGPVGQVSGIAEQRRTVGIEARVSPAGDGTALRVEDDNRRRRDG